MLQMHVQLDRPRRWMCKVYLHAMTPAPVQALASLALGLECQMFLRQTFRSISATGTHARKVHVWSRAGLVFSDLLIQWVDRLAGDSRLERNTCAWKKVIPDGYFKGNLSGVIGMLLCWTSGIGNSLDIEGFWGQRSLSCGNLTNRIER